MCHLPFGRFLNGGKSLESGHSHPHKGLRLEVISIVFIELDCLCRRDCGARNVGFGLRFTIAFCTCWLFQIPQRGKEPSDTLFTVSARPIRESSSLRDSCVDQHRHVVHAREFFVDVLIIAEAEAMRLFVRVLAARVEAGRK